VWLTQDDCVDAQSEAARPAEGGLALRVCQRRVQRDPVLETLAEDGMTRVTCPQTALDGPQTAHRTAVEGAFEASGRGRKRVGARCHLSIKGSTDR
jgi:hypothetical protein